MQLTLAALETDPHPLLHALRASEPVAYVEALGGWLVTRRDLALQVMRDAQAFTVDDPRFSTQRVVGPSMLSLDGTEHERHRAPFARGFRRAEVRERLGPVVACEARRLLDGLDGDPVELRRSFAGPLAAAVMGKALLLDVDPAKVLEIYDAIVSSVSGVNAGREPTEAGARAFAALSAAIGPALGRAGDLARDEVVSNAAVLLFGGIETTEGMIANAVWHLLTHPVQLELVRRDRALLSNAVEESLRLEPAAALVDRYAMADTRLGGADIGAGDLVSVAVAGANRDPAAFPDPDRFDVRRPDARRHLAFAAGPHVCLGMHLARLEARTALAGLLDRFPRLRLDTARPAAPRGLVFRKPAELWVHRE